MDADSRPLQLVARLRDLVAFDTQNPAGNEQPLAEKLAADLRDLGAHTVQVQSVGKHAMVYARLGAAPPTLLINAHIDTVPANTGYTHPPLELTRVDDRLHGLGACDTKGSIAAVMDALHMCRDAGRLPEHVGILFSGDEERKGTCVRAFLQSENARGLRHAIACEPTGCRMGTRHRGIIGAQAIATSPGGHSSRADHLPAPIVTLARSALALDALGKRHLLLGPPGFQGLCMNVAGIDGGIAMNVVPSRARLLLSMRPAPGTDVSALLTEVESMARIAAQPEPITWETETANPPFSTRDPVWFCRLLGLPEAACIDLDFWTEAALFTENGIDAIVLGPGNIEQAHAPDEYVELSQLQLARDLFLQAMETG